MVKIKQVKDKGPLGEGPEGAVTGDKAPAAPQGSVTTPVSTPLVSNEIAREASQEHEQGQERTQEYDRAQEHERTLEVERPAPQAHNVPTSRAPEPSVREPSDKGPRPVTPRPMRLTPGGGYGALLAHARPKRQQPDGPEVKAVGPAESLTPPPFGRATDPQEITAVGGVPAASRLGTSKGAARRPRIITPEHTVPTGSDFDGSEITAVGGAVRGPALEIGSGVGAAGSGTTTTTSGVSGDERRNPIPRPTRLTPGSGGLAALLAQGRSRARAEQPTVDREAPTQPPAVETPAIAPTQAPESVDGAAPTAAPAVKKFPTTLRPGIVTPPQIDVPPGPASLPEAKNVGLAGTLLGVRPPEIDASERGGKDGPWVKRFAGVGAGSGPQAVDALEWTEKNSAIPLGDSGGQSTGDAVNVFDSAGSVTTAADRRRITASFDIPRANSGHRRAIGGGIAAAVLAAVVGVLWPRPHPRPSPPAVTVGVPPASVVEPLPSAPTATPAPSNQPAAVPTVAEPTPAIGTPAPSSEVVKAKAAPAAAPAEEPAAAIAAPVAPTAGEGAVPQAARAATDGASNSPGAPTAVDQTEVPVAETAAPSARKHAKAKPKTKRKSGASRSRREGSVVAQPPDVKSEAPRSKAAGESDPDATLPLLMGR